MGRTQRNQNTSTPCTNDYRPIIVSWEAPFDKNCQILLIKNSEAWTGRKGRGVERTAPTAKSGQTSGRIQVPIATGGWGSFIPSVARSHPVRMLCERMTMTLSPPVAILHEHGNFVRVTIEYL